MPNWCSNSLTITGDAEELARLKDAIKGEDENGKEIPFDFNKVVPQPEGLLEQEGDAWYNWRNAHWGTKWNLDDDVWWKEDNAASGTLALGFDTAWSPPTPVIAELASQFPALQFEFVYYEPGNVFAGLERFGDGSCVESVELDGSGSEAVESEQIAEFLTSIGYEDEAQMFLPYEEDDEQQE